MRFLWIKNALKKTIPPLLEGWYERRLQTAANMQSMWLVLMYHRVVADMGEDPYRLGMCVTEQTFRRQLAFLKEFFEPLSLLDGVTRIQQGRPLPRMAVSITFDDGYADTLYRALPILEQHAMPATVYITTGPLKSQEPMWWDRVIAAVYDTQAKELLLENIGLSADVPRLKLGLKRAGGSVEYLLKLLWQQPPEKLEVFVEKLETILLAGSRRSPRPKTLTCEEIARVHARGVEIGAHTVRHPNLTLMSHQRALEEITASKRTLEAVCGTEIKGFAYPAGYVNDTVVQAVKATGLSYAVTGARGLNRSVNDLFMIERVGAAESPVADLKRCITALARDTRG